MVPVGRLLLSKDSLSADISVIYLSYRLLQQGEVKKWHILNVIWAMGVL